MPPKQKKGGTGELQVSIEHFIRTRDQVIFALHSLQSGLSNVQNGLTDLLNAYTQHTTSILAGEDNDFDRLQLPASIAATANATMEAATLAANGINQVAAASNQVVDGAAAEGKTKKRKREKKEKDPNAPKKPLTAAFLYAQTARSIVRADLESGLAAGEALEKNAVNLETTKRWNELPDEEKEKWKASYRHSMEQYKLELAEYLAKKGEKLVDMHIDEDMSDDGEAEIEAEIRTIDSDVSSDDEDEPVTKEPSPPAAKTPRPNKRQKTAQAAAANGTGNSANTSTPVPVPGTRSAAAPVKGEAPAAAKKDTKKKGKAAPAVAAPIAPAPASETKEDTPEEASKVTKKPKSSRSTRAVESEVDKENAAVPTQEKEKKKRERSKRKSDEKQHVSFRTPVQAPRPLGVGDANRRIREIEQRISRIEKMR